MKQPRKRAAWTFVAGTALLGGVCGLTQCSQQAQSPDTIVQVALLVLSNNGVGVVVSQPDGTPASLGGEFPSGKYAVSVAQVAGGPPRRYEVRVEKL